MSGLPHGLDDDVTSEPKQEFSDDMPYPPGHELDSVAMPIPFVAAHTEGEGCGSAEYEVERLTTLHREAHAALDGCGVPRRAQKGDEDYDLATRIRLLRPPGTPPDVPPPEQQRYALMDDNKTQGQRRLTNILQRLFDRTDDLWAASPEKIAAWLIDVGVTIAADAPNSDGLRAFVEGLIHDGCDCEFGELGGEKISTCLGCSARAALATSTPGDAKDHECKCKYCPDEDGHPDGFCICFVCGTRMGLTSKRTPGDAPEGPWEVRPSIKSVTGSDWKVEAYGLQHGSGVFYGPIELCGPVRDTLNREQEGHD